MAKKNKQESQKGRSVKSSDQKNFNVSNAINEITANLKHETRKKALKAANSLLIDFIKKHLNGEQVLLNNITTLEFDSNDNIQSNIKAMSSTINYVKNILANQVPNIETKSQDLEKSLHNQNFELTDFTRILNSIGKNITKQVPALNKIEERRIEESGKKFENSNFKQNSNNVKKEAKTQSQGQAQTLSNFAYDKSFIEFMNKIDFYNQKALDNLAPNIVDKTEEFFNTKFNERTRRNLTKKVKEIIDERRFSILIEAKQTTSIKDIESEIAANIIGNIAGAKEIEKLILTSKETKNKALIPKERGKIMKKINEISKKIESKIYKSKSKVNYAILPSAKVKAQTKSRE